MSDLDTKPRDHRLDTAKGVLIVLVVLGHLLEQTNFWDAGSTRLPLTAFYLFHMPAFVFLAGVTAKTSRLFERAGTLLVLLLTFQGLYWVFDAVIESPHQFGYFPFWVLWFLLTMIYWQLLLPMMVRFPKSAMVLSVAAACCVGTFDVIGNDMALSRAIIFLPFYVAGALYGRRILALAVGTSVTVKVGLVVASAVVIWFVFSLHMNPRWFFGNRSFLGLDVGVAEGVTTRAGLLAVACLLTVALLCLVPNRVGATAAVGRRSLAVYLGHLFVIMAITPLLPLVWAEAGRTAALATCVLFTVLIVVACAHPTLDKAIRAYSGSVVRLAAAPFSRREPVGAGSRRDG